MLTGVAEALFTRHGSKKELLNSSTHLFINSSIPLFKAIICIFILLHFHLNPSVPLRYFNSEREYNEIKLFILRTRLQFFLFFFFNRNYFLVNCGFIIPEFFYREHHPPNLPMDLKSFFETNTFKNSSSWQML